MWIKSGYLFIALNDESYKLNLCNKEFNFYKNYCHYYHRYVIPTKTIYFICG